MNKRQGFTLIELLVVITIIVILLALLAPALDKAIAHAERVVCMANEKVLGMAIFSYLQDNRRVFPNGIPHLPDEEDGLYPVVPYPPGVKPPHQLLVPYTLNTKAFYCPTDPDPTQFNWWAYNDYPAFFIPDVNGPPPDAQKDPLGSEAAAIRGPGRNLGASYMFSEQAGKDIRPFKPQNLKGSSANLAYLADGILVVNGWSWGTVDALDPAMPPPPNYWILRVSWSHLDTISMLMADTSVQSVRQFNITDGKIRERIRSDPMNDRLPQ